MNTRKHKRRLYAHNMKIVIRERTLNLIGYKTCGHILSKGRLVWKMVRVIGEQA